MIAQVDQPALAKPARATRNGRVKGYTVALFPMSDLFSYLGDDAGSFVAHDDGWHAASGGTVHPMHVAAADPARLHPDQDVIVRNLRVRRIPKDQVFVFR